MKPIRAARNVFWLALLAPLSCGNLMDSTSCMRGCEDRHMQCLTGALMLNIPSAQSVPVNGALVLSCESDRTSCEERCGQPLSE